MTVLRVIRVLLLFMAVVFASCEEELVPDALRVPALPSVSAVAEGSSVVLTGGDLKARRIYLQRRSSVFISARPKIRWSAWR